MTMLSSKSPKSSTALPKRPVQKKQNKLGPYNLLQTLGEGEFGKVKLGIHSETGQEVLKFEFKFPFFAVTNFFLGRTKN